MTKDVQILYIGILFLILLLCCGIFISCMRNEANQNNLQEQAMDMIDSQYHPANYLQYESSVQMSVCNGELYFSPKRSPLQDCRMLYVLQKETPTTVTKLADDILAMVNGYVYYSDVNSNSEWCLYCYDIAANETVMLVPMERYVLGNSMDWRESYLADDGTYCFCADDTFYPIKGTLVGEPLRVGETYTMGNYSYYIDGRALMRKHADTPPKSLSEYVPDGVKCMIPCEGGLLIHNAYNGELLYFIEEESGKIVELFSVPCIYSVSAVNVHGTDVFLSFKRFEKEGLFGSYVRFKNDTLEGTYRISLNDYAVEKISDEIYNGLFIFDDTGIYACDEDCHIYKLDFDGNLISTLLE